jgi:anti-anti-sigma regulatory factor
MTPWRVSLNSIDVVVLEPEPRLYAQLDGLIDTVRENSNQDVVLDFSAVGMLTTSGISRLMRLRSLLDGSGRRLILC